MHLLHLSPGDLNALNSLVLIDCDMVSRTHNVAIVDSATQHQVIVRDTNSMILSMPSLKLSNKIIAPKAESREPSDLLSTQSSQYALVYKERRGVRRKSP